MVQFFNKDKLFSFNKNIEKKENSVENEQSSIKEGCLENIIRDNLQTAFELVASVDSNFSTIESLAKSLIILEEKLSNSSSDTKKDLIKLIAKNKERKRSLDVNYKELLKKLQNNFYLIPENTITKIILQNKDIKENEQVKIGEALSLFRQSDEYTLSVNNNSFHVSLQGKILSISLNDYLINSLGEIVNKKNLNIGTIELPQSLQEQMVEASAKAYFKADFEAYSAELEFEDLLSLYESVLKERLNVLDDEEKLKFDIQFSDFQEKANKLLINAKQLRKKVNDLQREFRDKIEPEVIKNSLNTLSTFVDFKIGDLLIKDASYSNTGEMQVIQYNAKILDDDAQFASNQLNIFVTETLDLSNHVETIENTTLKTADNVILSEFYSQVIKDEKYEIISKLTRKTRNTSKGTLLNKIEINDDQEYVDVTKIDKMSVFTLIDPEILKEPIFQMNISDYSISKIENSTNSYIFNILDENVYFTSIVHTDKKNNLDTETVEYKNTNGNLYKKVITPDAKEDLLLINTTFKTDNIICSDISKVTKNGERLSTNFSYSIVLGKFIKNEGYMTESFDINSTDKYSVQYYKPIESDVNSQDYIYYTMQSRNFKNNIKDNTTIYTKTPITSDLKGNILKRGTTKRYISKKCYMILEDALLADDFIETK